MGNYFDEWWEQAKFQFVDETPPLKTCGNCGKYIISRWDYGHETLLLHDDKSMCSTVQENV